MAEKAYGGKFPCEPMENACEMRKSGDMPKTFVKSARNPVNMKLERRTSFCTSLAMLSTVPGLGSPRAALRSENVAYASFMAAATELSVRKESGDEKSAILGDRRAGRESEGSTPIVAGQLGIQTVMKK